MDRKQQLVYFLIFFIIYMKIAIVIRVIPIKGIVYTSLIIASLKYNFSRYLINPMNFLKLQMKDFSNYNDKFKLYFEQVKNESNATLFK